MRVHLILWILAVLVVSFYCVVLVSDLDYYYSYLEDCTSTEYHQCGPGGPFESQGAADRYFHIWEALIALGAMLLILHFTLLVMAYIERNRRRSYEKKTKIIYLVASPGTADGRMYYNPPDQLPQGNTGLVLAPQLSHHPQRYGNSA